MSSIKATMRAAGIASDAPRYRRSSVCKAPRKRSFIQQMTKQSMPCMVPIQATSHVCTIASVDLDDGCRGGFNGGAGGSGHSRMPGGGGGGGGGDSGLPLSSKFTMGVAVALACCILVPATAAQAAAEPTTEVAAPGSKAIKAGYFAVSGFSSVAPKVPRHVANAIPYGVVDLSPKEHRMVAGGLLQLNWRESMHA